MILILKVEDKKSKSASKFRTKSMYKETWVCVCSYWEGALQFHGGD